MMPFSSSRAIADLKIDRSALKDASWWHWTLTVPLLACQLQGMSWAIYVAMGLCLFATLYFYRIVGQWKPFPVQVRIAYMGLLILGNLPWMEWIHWVQLFGTTAMISVGYCPLIRMLKLLPYNRQEPLSWRYTWKTLFRDACAGGLVTWSQPFAEQTAACCSLAQRAPAASCSVPQSSFFPGKHQQA